MVSSWADPVTPSGRARRPSPAVPDLLQVAGSADQGDVSVALVEQVLHGQPAALDVVDRHRAQVGRVARPVQEDDRDAPSAQLRRPGR